MQKVSVCWFTIEQDGEFVGNKDGLSVGKEDGVVLGGPVGLFVVGLAEGK